MELDEVCRKLQERFAMRDFFTEKRPRPRSGSLDVLLIKKNNMKLKIYQETGHQLPHIHIDYGKKTHVASYSIETGERLEGSLSRRFDKDVVSWLSDNRERVLEIWNALQKGEDHEGLISELAGDV